MSTEKRVHFWLVFTALSLVLLAACGPARTPDIQLPATTAPMLATPTVQQVLPSLTATLLPPTATPTATATPVPTPAPVRFAVIGDYGQGTQPEADVAALVKSWNPDFIITVGDNNYPSGAAETIDQNIGQFYREYIYPYTGSYGSGADQLRFFPTLGNHDWDTQRGQPYLDYFELPGNERYYDFTWGPLHFFALSSDSREPDGVNRASIQAQWLQAALANTSLPWKIVYFHHAPYASNAEGGVDWMRWPFAQWGASVVLAGHHHVYERLIIDGLPYFVNGVGGGPIYDFHTPVQGSVVRYNRNYGAMLVIADERQILFQFITRLGEVVDSFLLER